MTENVIERLVEALNTRDGTTVAQIYTEAATIVGQSDQPLHGRGAITENYEAYFRAFPDFSFQLKSHMGSGALLCCEGAFNGTHTGPELTSNLVFRD